MNSCRTSRNHDLMRNFQPVANWVAAIYWGWSMITKKPWESLSTLNQPERDDTGFGRPPGHPMVTSGHPAIGSPWSCWGIRDRAVEWCEKRETWGAQLVARLHKILTCKKTWRSRLIDCICCIMLHIFMFDYAYRILSMRMMWLKQPKNIGSMRPAAQVSLRFMGCQVNEGDKHAGDWLIVSSTLNWRYDIFASQIHNIGCRMFQGSSSSFPYILDAKTKSTEIPFQLSFTRWVCLKIVYIPNEIAIFHRDNDQQNHWVNHGVLTTFSDKPRSTPQKNPRPVESYWTWPGRWLR